MGPLGVDHGEHLAADAEYQVAAPFNVFRDSGQAQAEGSNRFNRHRLVWQT
jgi:hypothetical protein